VKILKTKWDWEYMSDHFKEPCEQKGIIQQLTAPYTPQQNGVMERIDITLLDMVRYMMMQANLLI